MREVYFAADVEASHGKPVQPGITNLLSIGLVVVGDPDEHLYLELRPINAYWDPEAEKVHGIGRWYAVRYGTDPHEAMTRIARWVRSVAGDAPTVFCAMPLTYDWVLTDWYFLHTRVANPFRHTLDGRDLYRQVQKLPPGAEVTREQFHRDYPSDIPHLHHALGDTLEFEEQLRPMLVHAGRL